MTKNRTLAFLLTLIAVAVPSSALADESTAFKGHKREVNTVAISSDGKLLVSGSDDSSVRVWDPTGEGANDRSTDQGAVKALVVIGAAYGDLTLWDRTSGKDVYTKKGHDLGISAIAFFPNGSSYVTASINDELKIWETTTGKEKAKLTGHKYTVRGLAISPDGNRIYSCDEGGNVFVWNGKGKQLQTFEIGKGQIHGIALTKDGKLLASGFGDGSVVFSLAATGKELGRVKLADSVNSVSFSPDGKMLAVGTQGEELALINPATPEVIRTLKGHSRPITSVAFSADGKVLASASMDYTVRAWPMK